MNIGTEPRPVPNIDSVLVPLLDSVQRSIFRVASEREAELAELLRSKSITAEVDCSRPEWRFESSEMCRRYFMNLKAMERIWAYCCGSIYVYLRLNDAKFRGPMHFDEDELGRETKRLLQWALEAEFDKNYQPWPSEILRPGIHTDGMMLAQSADEVFLFAMGFIQLHEIGHLVLGHRNDGTTPKDVLLKWEFEADEFAYDWIMDCWRTPDGNPKIFVKRSMLVSNLIAVLACLTAYLPEEVEKVEHPNPIDRLLRFLIKHANEDAGLPVEHAWVVAVCTIQTHLLNKPDFDENQKWETSRDFLNANRHWFDKKEKVAS
jgi:peptidase U49-like protein